MSAPPALRLRRNFAGSYRAEAFGISIALIENADVAELPGREWLVTYYKYSRAMGMWIEDDADRVASLAEGKAAAASWLSHLPLFDGDASG